MILIVSKQRRVTSDVALVIDSLKEARKTVGYIEALIYIDGDDKELEFISDLQFLKKERGIGGLWYISEEADKKDFIELAILGNGGFCIYDTFYLQDYSLLESLVSNENTDTNSLSVVPSGVSVLEDFSERYLEDTNNSAIPSGYAKVLADSIRQLKEVTIKRSEHLPILTKIAVEKLEESTALTKALSAETESLQEVVRKLESNLKDFQTSQGTTNIAFFPRVFYKKERDIIRIKDIGRTPYLTSFSLGFQKYVQKILNKRPKLIFIEPVGSIIEDSYSEYTWITANNYNDKSIYSSEIVFTNHPTTNVLVNLIEDRFSDVFIVVDRTINSNDHILNSRNSRPVWFSLAGSHFIQKLKLEKIPRFRHFVAPHVDSDKATFKLPVGNYPHDKFDREAYYLNEAREEYRLLMKK